MAAATPMDPPPRACPSCGAAMDWRFELVRMRDCDQCGVTVALIDGDAQAVGERGEMAAAPSLLKLGEVTLLDGERWLPVGQLRFDYGAGWWDEFWCESGSGQGPVWISVDEGDIALEREVAFSAAPKIPGGEGAAPPETISWPADSRLSVYVTGESANARTPRAAPPRTETYRLSEAGEARCAALRGAVPEVIHVGERHRYWNYAGARGGLMSLERWAGGEAWFHGAWRDPWLVSEPNSAGPLQP